MLIKLTPNSVLLKDRDYLVRRIAHVVVGTDAFVQEKEENSWNLHYSNNDWFCHFKEDGIWVSYRYGMGGNQEMMKSLQTFLRWLFK